MIKIAHIALPVGGVGVYINLLARYINEKVYTNVVICNKEKDTIDINDKKGNEIKKFHVPFTREVNFLGDLKCLYKTIKILKKTRPDVIHCHSAKAGIIGRISGAYLRIPTLYTPHAYSYLSTEKMFRRNVFKNIEKAFRVFPSKTLACSQSEFNRTISDLKFNTEKALVWNNSIEENIKQEHSEVLNGIPKFFICSIGRPSYQKNTELLVEAIFEIKKTIKEIHLVVLGVGFYSPSLKKVKKMIKMYDLEENITLIPWLERTKTMAILQKSILYVSSSRYEGLPYSVIEALALSKPCVVTRVDGNKDLIKDKFNGFLVEEKANEIAKKIIVILKNKQLVFEMSINSKNEFMNKYDINVNIKELEKIYLSVIKN